ncbi:MAG: DUF3109 family protein [Chitinophagaceae bacterium]
MIAIDNVLISDEVIKEQFVCDLTRCKGGCCEDGDAGAPITKEEKLEIEKALPHVLPYLTKKGIKNIEQQGKYVFDDSFGWVTPTIDGEMCVYGFKDEQGILKCGFEQAYYDGKTQWKKPISCHLFPIKIQQSEINPDVEYMNYEPRTDLCSAACSLGQKLKVPVHHFLKEAIIRKYGFEFYETLDATATHLKNSQ